METFLTREVAGSLRAADLLVVAGAIVLLLLIAYFSGRRQRDTQDFFVGRRQVPALVACLAFVAAEISAMTIVAAPATSYASNWQYLQFFIGSAGARILVAFLFVPIFFRFSCTTVFEFLKHRFGRETQYAGSGFFFLTRLLASGVRLYVTALAMAVILNWDLWQAILLFTVVSIAFIAFGGIKAVMWTGAFQTLFFYGAGLAVGLYLLSQIDGGASTVARVAAAENKLDVVNLKLSLADPKTLWAATLTTFLLNLSIFGTDQDFMQRLLSVKTRRSSQKALIGTIAAGAPLLLLYVALGTVLYVFYLQYPHHGAPENTDKILSHCTVHWLPVGLKGLVLATIVLASIDSPLNSLSASFVTDIYRPLIRKSASERHYLIVSRCGVVGFGLVLAGLAFLFQSKSGGVLWVGLQVMGVTGGSTLGVFLLGMLTRRRSNRANVLAMTVSAAAMATLLYLINGGLIWLPGKGLFAPGLKLGWSWLIVIGTASTFLIGYCLGPVMERGRRPRPDDPATGL